MGIKFDDTFTFNNESSEYMALKTAADLLNRFSVDTRYKVGNTWFDYGQAWYWTTIIAEDGRGEYQALYPKDRADLIAAIEISEFFAVINRILEREVVRNSK